MLCPNHILVGYCILFFTHKRGCPFEIRIYGRSGWGLSRMFHEMDRTEGMLNDNNMLPSNFSLFQVSTLKGAYHFSEGAFKDEYTAF